MYVPLLSAAADDITTTAATAVAVAVAVAAAAGVTVGGILHGVLGPTPRGGARRVVDVEDAVEGVDARLPIGRQWHLHPRMMCGRNNHRHRHIRIRNRIGSRHR